MYLIRLDDASDHMDTAKWTRIEQLLDEYGIRPLVGVIPLNRDPKLLKFPEDPGFWQKAREWQAKGWRIALHGYEHLYCSDCGGMNPVHDRSEFAGLPLEAQRQKIREGMKLLKEKGLEPDVFFAPSHTFDENTLEALRLETDIRIVSDTVANDVYCHKGFTFIPQQSGRVRKLPFRLTTVCLHPNIMQDRDLEALPAFFRTHRAEFLDPCAIGITDRKLGPLDHACRAAYQLKRKLAGLFRLIRR